MRFKQLQAKILLTCFLLTGIGSASAQQVADTAYHPLIADKAYLRESGPAVCIDEGHNNFHTKDGRYRVFANVLEDDGYVVNSHSGGFTPESLADCEILVISNAMHESTLGNWILPTASAFTGDEIETVEAWVRTGGSLFLIADHMPMAGAAADLAAAFGFHFTNGFAMDTLNTGPILFRKEDGTLADNLLTRGRTEDESVDAIASFTGQAFQHPEGATPILLLPSQAVNLLPDTAWVFHDDTRMEAAGGWSQGAYREYGEGRIVFFGEAAMFSAQLAGPQKYKAGMNAEIASQNYKLLLNIIHWLDGILN